MIVCGSTAIKHYFPDFYREPKDFDYLWMEPVGEYGDIITLPKNIIELFLPTKYGNTINLNDLLTLKLSHLGFDNSWFKHKNDVLYLIGKGADINIPLYYSLTSHWRKEYGNKEFLSLKKGKNKFFDDFVNYKYDHDYLHKLVAGDNDPLYKSCLVDGEDVLIDIAKFNKLPENKQIKMFKEEITVIAVERWLLHPDNKLSIIESYEKSLHKTMTRLTKGWATDFLAFYLEEFVRPDREMFENILNSLPEGEKIMGKKLNEIEVRNLCQELSDCLADSDWNEGDYIEDCYSFLSDPWKFNGLFNYEEIDETGGEGQGEYAHLVFKWENTLYKLEYNYYSYQGPDFECASLSTVEEKQKTVTVYE